MPYPFPTIDTLIQQARADITGSDLPNADGFLQRAILPLMGVMQAGFALGHYDSIAYAMRQATPFTATDEWLEAWGALKNIFRKDAAAAGSVVEFVGAIVGRDLPAGSLLQSPSGVTYATTVDAIVAGNGTVSAPFLAISPGAAGNAPAGTTLTLQTGIDGVPSTGEAISVITGGADQEIDDDLRTRMLYAFANPPGSGNQTDYVRWTTAVAGVTRAWCVPLGAGAGTVVIYFMMDDAQAANGGFPQGTNGVAAAEPRDAAATGDQLTVANALFDQRRIPALVYACAPASDPITYTIGELSPNTAAIQDAIETALAAMHLRKAVPGGTLYPSDWDAAIQAVPGIEHFVVLAPATAHTSAPGAIATVAPMAAGNFSS